MKLHFSNLLQVAKGGKGPYSEIVIEKLSRSFYVDNCTTSVESEEKLREFITSATDIIKFGGFDLRDWEYTHDRSDKESTLVLELLFNKVRDSIAMNPVLLKDEGNTSYKAFDFVGSAQGLRPNRFHFTRNFTTKAFIENSVKAKD